MIEIVIRMHDDQPGQPVTVQGPIANKVLCYGILEAAKVAVHDFDPAKQRLVRVAEMPPVGVPVPGNGALKS